MTKIVNSICFSAPYDHCPFCLQRDVFFVLLLLLLIVCSGFCFLSALCVSSAGLDVGFLFSAVDDSFLCFLSWLLERICFFDTYKTETGRGSRVETGCMRVKTMFGLRARTHTSQVSMMS